MFVSQILFPLLTICLISLSCNMEVTRYISEACDYDMIHEVPNGIMSPNIFFFSCCGFT